MCELSKRCVSVILTSPKINPNHREFLTEDEDAAVADEEAAAEEAEEEEEESNSLPDSTQRSVV